MKRKNLIGCICLVSILCLSYLLYTLSLHQSTYNGLPTVPCFDTTKPVQQQYSVTIHLTILGKSLPLDAGIGHDYGKCLHTIYTNDASGTVYVRANDSNQYTLGQFFDVWHKTFTPTQCLEYPLDATHHVRILVNGKKVSTLRDTPLFPHETIAVIYE